MTHEEAFICEYEHHNLKIDVKIYFSTRNRFFYTTVNGELITSPNYTDLLNKLEDLKEKKINEIKRPAMNLEIDIGMRQFNFNLDRAYLVGMDDYELLKIPWENIQKDPNEFFEHGTASEFILYSANTSSYDRDDYDHAHIYLPYSEDLYQLFTDMIQSLNDLNRQIYNGFIEAIGFDDDLKIISHEWYRGVLDADPDLFQEYLDKRLPLIQDYINKVKIRLESENRHDGRSE